MFTLFIVLHVIFCVFLILVILLQTGKGAGIGAAFGGGSQTVFGPRGAGSFIGKATGIVAALFMLTSIVLAYMSTSKSSGVADKVAALNEVRSQNVQEVELGESTDEAKDAAALPAQGIQPTATTDAGKVETKDPVAGEADKPIAAPAPDLPAPTPAAEDKPPAEAPPTPIGEDTKAPE